MAPAWNDPRVGEAGRCADESRRKAIVAHATRSERATAIAAFLKLAESDPSVAVLPHELDADRWLLNCKNGTLDLRTARIRAPSPDDLIAKATPLAYDSKASSELWNRVLGKPSAATPSSPSTRSTLRGAAMQASDDRSATAKSRPA
jgi:phage/plasmid-associated DNA primase